MGLGSIVQGAVFAVVLASKPEAGPSTSACEQGLRRLPAPAVEVLAEQMMRDSGAVARVEASIAQQLGPGATQGALVAGLADVARRVHARNDLRGAGLLWSRAVSLRIETCLYDTPTHLAWLDEAAEALRSAWHPAEAEPIYRDLLRRRTRVQGPNAAPTLQTETALGDTLRMMRRYAESRTLLEGALKRALRHLGRNHRETAYARQRLALLLDEGPGTDAEALAQYKEVVAIRDASEPGSIQAGRARINLAGFLIEIGRSPEAMAPAREAVALWASQYGQDSLALLTPLEPALRSAHLSKRWPVVLEACGHAMRVLERNRGPDHPEMASWLARAHAAHLALGQADAARAVEAKLSGLRGEAGADWLSRFRLLDRLTARGESLERLFAPPPGFALVQDWPWVRTWRDQRGIRIQLVAVPLPPPPLFGLVAPPTDADVVRNLGSSRDAETTTGETTVAGRRVHFTRFRSREEDHVQRVDSTVFSTSEARYHLEVSGEEAQEAQVAAAGQAARERLRLAPPTAAGR